jgi:hypothetical protein
MKIDSGMVEAALSGYNAVFHKPPVRIPDIKVVDAPLIGNGDVGIAIAGDGSELKLYIGKNDFWRQAHLGESWEQRLDRLLTPRKGYSYYQDAFVRTVGQIQLWIEELKDSGYYQEQDLFHAEIRGRFEKDGYSLKTRSWVHAEKNILFVEFENAGEKEIHIKWNHFAGTNNHDSPGQEFDSVEDGLWYTLCANAVNAEGRRMVAVATRVLGAAVKVDADTFRPYAEFSLEPGRTAVLASVIVSDLDAAENGIRPSKFGIKTEELIGYALPVSFALTAESVCRENAEHRAWWSNFWTESFVRFGDPLLEQYYYGSNYILASCMRKGKVPPGLYGNWVTTDTSKWTGSYTTNYNYQSPYWGLYSGNHIAMTESYCEPLLDAIRIGKIYARELLGCKGIYIPVELGPWGVICGALFHSQKSNAAFCCVNLLMHIYYTWDLEYAGKVYPFLKETAEFWETYLKFENGRYVVYQDSVSESPVTEDKNSVFTLALIRMLFSGILKVARELAVDEDKYEKWQHILDHISDYPTQQINGRTVFRLTESGTAWSDSWTLGVLGVFPTGQIGKDSCGDLYQIARNTFDAMQRWDDYNGFSTYYTAGARLGCPPEVLLENLKKQCELHGLPNRFIFHGGGGIEDSSTIPSCIHEMFLQSYEGVLRFFPNWPRNRDADFINLRAYGAFLVSGGIKGGAVESVCIESEKGKSCRVQNPWPGFAVRVIRGTGTELLYGELLDFKTLPGETVRLVPEKQSNGIARK